MRIRPEVDKAEFAKAGQQAAESAGSSAGKAYGDKFATGSSGPLRNAHGKFVSDSTAAGGRAGAGFSSGFGKGTSKLKDVLKKNVPLAAGLFVPLGLGAAVAQIGSIGMAYEDNLNIFKSVSKATGAQMATVAAQARKLGADVNLPGVSAAGAAEAMTELAKAGFSVQQSMDAAQGTLQLARIANISEANAAEIAANAVNAFGLQAKQTSFVVDELAAAANSSSVEISDVSDAFKMAAAVFSGVQGPAVGSKTAITELNTAIAILGNNGIKGSDAGTSLKQMLLQLTGPSAQAKDQMQYLALRAAGATATLTEQNQVLHGSVKVRGEAIASIIKHNKGIADQGDIAYDASGKMRGLRDIIALTAAGTKGLTQEDKNYAITQIFGSDAARSVIALLKGGLPVYDRQTKAILATGSAASVAAAKNAGLRGSIDNVKSQFENAAISIYNQVKGPLTTGLNAAANAVAPLADGVATLGNVVRSNSGIFGTLASAVLGAAAAYGVLKVALYAAAAAQRAWAVIQAGIAFVQLAAGVRSFAAAWALLDAAMAANPIGIVVVAIGALVAGLIYAYRHSETFRAIVQATWSGIKTAIGAVAGWITGTVWPALVAAWHAIADAALWLWHNVIEPAWHGIQVAIAAVVTVVRGYIAVWSAIFRGIAAVVVWLYQNIFAPYFRFIAAVVHAAWVIIEIAVAAIRLGLTALGNAVRALYEAVIAPVFRAIAAVFRALYAVTVQPVINLIKLAWHGLAIALQAAYNVTLRPLFAAFSALVRVWGAALARTWEGAKTAWRNLASFFTGIWNNNIRPFFQHFGSFISGTVAPAFRTGVEAIRKAWEKVQEAARKPVAFVVNRVINPFIGGINKAAAFFGVKDRVPLIAGYARGGRIPGYASGGRISGPPAATDNRQATVAGLGPVQLMGGEFIVNSRDTAKALPLLRWINDGMKGGPLSAAKRIGRTPIDAMGDGSEGWAFKDGGLIGWVKDVWSAVTNPVALVKRPFEAALRALPGGGAIRGFLTGAADKALGWALHWLTGGAGGAPGNAGKAQAFVRAQAGKPYIWASAGPAGYDCSGIVSAAYNVLKGHNPYAHTFSTEALPDGWFREGMRTGPLIAGWSHPGQYPASAGTGHMAGNIAGMPFESRGSMGVVIGDRARSVGQFAHIGSARFADGGLLGEPVRLFDRGGFWPSGTLGANLSGRTEYVQPAGAGSAPIVFNNYGVIGSEGELDAWLTRSVKRLRNERKLP